MRIIKLSPKDSDTRTLEETHRFFNETLAQREPEGRFVCKSYIAKGGLYEGETLVFTYKAKIIYIAKAQTPPEGDKESRFFCVDMDTLVEANGRDLSELGSDLAEYSPEFTVDGQGWNSIDISEEDAREVLEGYADAYSVSGIDDENSLLVFNVAWMKRYEGKTRDDSPIGGGSHIDENQECGEMWNFLNVDGVCYGYGMTKKIDEETQSASGVDLAQLTSEENWSKGEEAGNIDVVFIAKNPAGAPCVVGWYRNASVLHKDYDVELRDRHGHHTYGHLCRVKAGNAFLVNESERTEIPSSVWQQSQSRHRYISKASRLGRWLVNHTEELNVPSVRAAAAQNIKTSEYDQFKEDESAILDDASIPATQKEQLTNARLGQGRFRDGVIKLHGECVVTGVKTPDLLVASHIKPWRESDNAERLDPHNGLLLVATYDKLFDKGYITFNAEGELRLSAALSKRDREILGIKHVKINLSDQARAYMKYHREKIFKN